MWIAILGIIDKLLGMFDFFAKRSTESRKNRAAAQVQMNKAVKRGDHDAYWDARAIRNRS